MSPAGIRFPRMYRSKGASEYRYVAAQEEDPIKVEDEVQTLISATEIEDRREAGELTQLKVLEKGEAGDRERTQDEGVRAGENKLVDVEIEAADGDSCSGWKTLLMRIGCKTQW